ncbi:hypothetical protein FVQ98_17170 [Ottowia sp. GY511]|uniref:Sirohydrochlorin chelatase n=1 Tax=Ottowia flava TaxID=2675430 RepID=A0ABW4KXR5_9BURK|nr:CbiX/SirB N-terminal domain-containing protein [Ottowia sp. GY511]TXK23415.1 hypothetical protein FVQ98_17170 [Ottowia sp. GY511]
MHGILVVAHGAQDPNWHKPIEFIVDRIRELRPDSVVRACYIEHTHPSFREAVRDMSACTYIKVCPLFFGDGSHMKRDVEAMRSIAQREFVEIEFQFVESLARDDRVVDALAATAADQ